MYTTYFGLREKPFNVTPDPRFFYANPVYREAYASLLTGVQERKGFVVMTGEVGTGKTTLLRLPHEEPRGHRPLRLPLQHDARASRSCSPTPATSWASWSPASGRLQRIQALNAFLIEQLRRGGTGRALDRRGPEPRARRPGEPPPPLESGDRRRRSCSRSSSWASPSWRPSSPQPGLRQLRQRVSRAVPPGPAQGPRGGSLHPVPAGDGGGATDGPLRRPAPSTASPSTRRASRA